MKILLVDDCPDIREVLALALTLEGHEPTGAENGNHALSLIHAGYLPDLILLDIQMPVMDGNEFVGHFLKYAAESGLRVPIIYTTGETNPQVTLPGPILQKPLDLPTLFATIAGAAAAPRVDLEPRSL